MIELDILSILQSTLRLATPLILASLGGLLSERAGIVALGLEGMMLGGAFAAGTLAALTGSPWVGLFGAILIGVMLASLHGFVAIRHRGEQIVSGMALNFLMSGLCPTLGLGWFGIGGGTPPLNASARFMPLLFGQSLLVYLTIALVPVIWFILYRSRFGLRIRAVGENPEAVDGAGLSVAGLRYAALALCGALAGSGGAYIAIADGAGFSRDMTAGRGYVALAALVFGRWRPIATCFACLLFAFADALQLNLQGSSLPLIGSIPVPFVQALPYIVTLIVLAGVTGETRPPAALGRPFVRSG
jgi:simple sugar transport system permease protein